jgi:hypothetical protein
MMPSQNDVPASTRGTILVASSNALFTDVVGDLVAACGFTPEYSSGHEESCLLLTRTRPCVVICDCAAPAEGIQRLIVEASARHIPLVLSDMRMQQSTDHEALSPLQRLAWLTFPVSRDAFGAMLEMLLPSGIATSEHAAVSDAGRRIAAAVSLCATPLVLVPHDRSGPRLSDGTMDWSRTERVVDRDTVVFPDIGDLRAAIATALAARPVYEQSLRRIVWAYVDAERDRGAMLGQVIVTLTDLAEAAKIVPTSVRQAVMRGMILWGVEEYFNHPSDAVGVVTLHDDQRARSIP